MTTISLFSVKTVMSSITMIIGRLLIGGRDIDEQKQGTGSVCQVTGMTCVPSGLIPDNTFNQFGEDHLSYRNDESF